MSMLREIKSDADGPLRDDDLIGADPLNQTMTSATSGVEPDEALNAASPEPARSEASGLSAAQPRSGSGRAIGPAFKGPVLKQGGQRVGEIPRQLSSRGKNGRILLSSQVEGTWEVRVTVPEGNGSISMPIPNDGSNHNKSQQSSWSVSKSPRSSRRPVHVIHRHHHHHYHHHYFPVEGDEIPASAFVEGSGEEVSLQPAGGRFANSTSPSASSPGGRDSTEHRHFHYHHHAQSSGVPAHAQKLLDSSDRKQLEADTQGARGPSPGTRFDTSEGTRFARGNDSESLQTLKSHSPNMPGTHLPSLI